MATWMILNFLRMYINQSYAFVRYQLLVLNAALPFSLYLNHQFLSSQLPIISHYCSCGSSTLCCRFSTIAVSLPSALLLLPLFSLTALVLILRRSEYSTIVCAVNPARCVTGGTRERDSSAGYRRSVPYPSPSPGRLRDGRRHHHRRRPRPPHAPSPRVPTSHAA